MRIFCLTVFYALLAVSALHAQALPDAPKPTKITRQAQQVSGGPLLDAFARRTYFEYDGFGRLQHEKWESKTSDTPDWKWNYWNELVYNDPDNQVDLVSAIAGTRSRMHGTGRKSRMLVIPTQPKKQ